MQAGRGCGPSGCFGSGVCVGAWTASPGDRPRGEGPHAGMGFPLPHVRAGGAEQARPLLMPAPSAPHSSFSRGTSSPPSRGTGVEESGVQHRQTGARKPGQPTLPRPAPARASHSR